VGRRLGAIALLALLVRALIPAGYMVAAADTPDGRYLVMQLCDGHASEMQAINLETGLKVDLANLPKSPAKQASADQVCAFAASVSFAPPVSSVEPMDRVVATESETVLPRAASPGRGIAAPPPPATGPPSLI
jgi:hypothetical protein